MDVIYDRPVFRTSRTLTLLLMFWFLVMLASITWNAVTNPALSPTALIPLMLYVVLVLAMTARVITGLRELEREHPTPTKAMELLYTVALLLPPTAGLIPISLVLRYVRLVAG